MPPVPRTNQCDLEKRRYDKGPAMGSRAARRESTSRNGQTLAFAALVMGLTLTMTRALGVLG